MSKYNPKEIDYNKDGEVDSYDDIYAVKDFDGDGKVTDKEEQKFRKKRDETSTEYVYNAKGDLVKTKTEGSGVDVPEPTMDFSEYTDRFLKNHPDVAKAIELAIENNWNQDVFNRYVETKTQWGKNTTDAQAAFDLQYTGTKNEDVKQQIKVKSEKIIKAADAAGVTISQEEADRYAKTFLRNQLDDDAMTSWIANKFTMPTATTDGDAAGQPPPLEGTASTISSYMKEMARQYGLPVNDEYLQEKVREGLAQGRDWQTWAEGQRDILRNQAKLSYPTVADQFDSYTLQDIMTPYLNIANNMLGVSKTDMNLDDPMWNAALKGEGGPLSLDDWVSKLKTDKQYGWTKTADAKQRASELGSSLLRAFGMAS